MSRINATKQQWEWEGGVRDVPILLSTIVHPAGLQSCPEGRALHWDSTERVVENVFCSVQHSVATLSVNKKA